MYNDLRFALRMLRKNPGFTAVAAVTLALGIGGTTVIFSVLYGVALEPFPYADSHRLVQVVTHDPRYGQFVGDMYLSAPEFLDYREQNQVFDEVLGAVGEFILMSGTDGPDTFRGTRVTDNTFRVLGVPPLIGRPLTPDDGKPGAPSVAVLSHQVWQNKFGADSGIVGRTLILNGQPTTVVGVMPPRFTWGINHDLWLPATLSRDKPTHQPQRFLVRGHLRPGVSIEQAAADVAVLSKRFALVYPQDHPKEVTFGVESLAEHVVGEFGKTLKILLGSVGLLLLIACVNVANLLLACATAREREIAIRAALGASRCRLVRQFLIESLLVALAGGVLGCLLAWNVLGGLLAVIPPDMLPSEAEIRINGLVLLFTLGTSLLCTLLFGLAPALLAARRDPQQPLKGSSRGAGESAGHSRLRKLLVVSEVALSLVLLTGGGLLIRSFFALHEIELGYNPDNVLTASVALPEEKYKTAEQRNQFSVELLRRVRALPGVVSAALGDPPPTWSGEDTAIEVDGRSSGNNSRAFVKLASDRLIETLGIQLLQGRTISEGDFKHAQRVAVISRAFARKYFRGENPLGRQIKMEEPFEAVQPPWFEIVGVVVDIRDNGPESPLEPAIYVPYTAASSPYDILLMRTMGGPARLLNSLRREVAAMDKRLRVLGPVYDGMLQGEVNTRWFAQPRLVFTMLTAFAALGLTLVSIGVYGVLSYAVSRRTQEIGIRMALGAQATEVRRMVMMSGLRWLLVGIGIGVPASIALAKILQNRIWGIKSADPLTLIAVSLLLTAVGLAACYFPAHRATKVDPIVSLRYE